MPLTPLNLVDEFIQKIKVGIDVPNYPQHRDMNTMFLEMVTGIQKTVNGYIFTEKPKLNKENSKFLEVETIKKNSKTIEQETGKPFEMRLCITGPYTLSYMFTNRSGETFVDFANIFSEILQKNAFNNKHGRVSIIAIDEPLFGVMDDLLLDYGAQSRELLLKSWETISHTAKRLRCDSMLHLHNTANRLYLNVTSLNVIDAHIQNTVTRKELENNDKKLKASITVSNYDTLLSNVFGSNTQKKASIWSKILTGQIDPTKYLETTKTMKKRLMKTLQKYGTENVPYAGPECGLKGHPTHNCAIQCLKRVARATINQKNRSEGKHC
jgi:5-methyltetrahydropteroyltriglutamate--homocysteine methyltransferase